MFAGTPWQTDGVGIKRKLLTRLGTHTHISLNVHCAKSLTAYTYRMTRVSGMGAIKLSFAGQGRLFLRRRGRLSPAKTEFLRHREEDGAQEAHSASCSPGVGSPAS